MHMSHQSHVSEPTAQTPRGWQGAIQPNHLHLCTSSRTSGFYSAPTPARNAFVLHRSHGSPLGSKQAASLLSAFCLFAFNSSHIRERPESRSHSQQAESSDFPSAFESCVKLHLVLPVFLQRPSGRNRAATAPLRPTAGEQRRRFRWDLTPPNPILRRPLPPRLHYSQPGPLLPEPPGHGVAITTTAERKQPPPPRAHCASRNSFRGDGRAGQRAARPHRGDEVGTGQPFPPPRSAPGRPSPRFSRRQHAGWAALTGAARAVGGHLLAEDPGRVGGE